MIFMQLDRINDRLLFISPGFLRNICSKERTGKMEEKMFEEAAAVPEVLENGKKPMDKASLILGIVAIAAAAFIPLISYVCGIIGLVFAIKRKKEKDTTLALVLCIVGLIGGVVSNVISAKMLMEAMQTAQ